MRFFALLCGALAMTSVGCAADSAGPSDDTSQDDDLIGGRLARKGEFDATMQVQGNCTVSKVGARLVLTAAHCVDYLSAGSPIRLTNAKAVGRFAKGDQELFKDYTLERVEVEPAWKEKCVSGGCGSVHVSGLNNMADAALLVTTEDIVGVPEAAIDLSPVREGDGVALAGFGCEDKVAGEWDYSGSRLRVSETFAIPFEDTVHEGSFVTEEDRKNGTLEIMRGIYVITPGPEWVRTASAAPDQPSSNARRGGLCPGDSGGPLYRTGRGNEQVVVGINANYTFSNGTSYTVDGRTFEYGGRPRTNWQTRVDGSSGLRVGQWLKSLGVNTVCTADACE